MTIPFLFDFRDLAPEPPAPIDGECRLVSPPTDLLPPGLRAAIDAEVRLDDEVLRGTSRITSWGNKRFIHAPPYTLPFLEQSPPFDSTVTALHGVSVARGARAGIRVRRTADNDEIPSGEAIVYDVSRPAARGMVAQEDLRAEVESKLAAKLPNCAAAVAAFGARMKRAYGRNKIPAAVAGLVKMEVTSFCEDTPSGDVALRFCTSVLGNAIDDDSFAEGERQRRVCSDRTGESHYLNLDTSEVSGFLHAFR